jgi:hypothetical protein
MPARFVSYKLFVGQSSLVEVNRFISSISNQLKHHLLKAEPWTRLTAEPSSQSIHQRMLYPFVCAVDQLTAIRMSARRGRRDILQQLVLCKKVSATLVFQASGV